MFSWCRRFGVTVEIHRMLNARQIDGPELFYIPKDFVAYTVYRLHFIGWRFVFIANMYFGVCKQASNQTIDRPMVTSFFADVKIHSTIFFIVFLYTPIEIPSFIFPNIEIIIHEQENTVCHGCCFGLKRSILAQKVKDEHICWSVFLKAGFQIGKPIKNIQVNTLFGKYFIIEFQITIRKWYWILN